MGIEMFDFKGHEVRVTVDEQGEPRWVASDVAKVLGYRDAEQMTRHLDSDEVSTEKVEADTTQNGTSLVRRMNVITESGLYMAIIKSERPEAVEFQRWVTREVLPSIRKHGGYISEYATVDQVEYLQEELSEMQKELRYAKDELSSSYSREDINYGLYMEAKREADSWKAVVKIQLDREEDTYSFKNLYDFLQEKTDHHGFARLFSAEFLEALLKPTGVGSPWVHVEVLPDGVYVHEPLLHKTWEKENFRRKYLTYVGIL